MKLNKEYLKYTGISLGVGILIGILFNIYFNNTSDYKEYYNLVTNKNEGTFVITGYDPNGKITNTVFTHKYIADKDLDRIYCKEMNTGELFSISGTYSVLDLSETSAYLEYIKSEIPDNF